MYSYIHLQQYHKLIYAEDVLTLNEANRDTSEITPGVPRLYGIAKPAGKHRGAVKYLQIILCMCGVLLLALHRYSMFITTLSSCLVHSMFTLYYYTGYRRLGCAEVSRLETNRETIFEAIRVSFAAAHDALVLDPADRVRT